MLAAVKKRPARVTVGPARVAVGPAGLVAITLAGTWIGHTLEYLRVWGSAGAAHSMAASVHAYMEPTGAGLLALGLLGVLSTARLARRLERRLRCLCGASVGRHGSMRSVELETDFPSRSSSLPTLLVTVWAGQCGLYLLQENIEASAAGRPLPRLAALGGIHALAAVVHLVVAATLVAALWLARRRVTQLADAVQRALERLRCHVIVAPAGPRRPRRAWTPLDRWGIQRWTRPPPAAVLH
jgi:hypothetical protein